MNKEKEGETKGGSRRGKEERRGRQTREERDSGGVGG